MANYRETSVARVLTRRAAAELIRIDIRRLRRYEQVGLVQPSPGPSGEPVYGEAELARIRRIQRLIDHCGLNLAGVEVVLRLTEQMEDLNRRVEAEMAEIRRRMDTI